MRNRFIFRKLTAIFLMFFMFQITAAAMTVLEIDINSPALTADVMGSSDYFENVVAASTFPYSYDPAVPSGQWNSRLDGQGDFQGAPTIIDGSATTNPVYPFRETVSIQRVSFRPNNGERLFFFKLFVSADGSTWTEITEATGDITRTNLTNSWGPAGQLDGPPVQGVFVTNNVGNNARNHGNVVTINFAPTAPVRYLRFQFYGNSAGTLSTDTIAPAGQWSGIRNLVVEGSVAAAAAPPPPPPPQAQGTAAPPIAAPGPGTTAASPAPQTSDAAIVYAALALAAVTALFLTVKKKRSGAI